MITQRELDIAQIEAKQKAEELYNEWHSDFLASRGKREANAEGPVRGVQAPKPKVTRPPSPAINALAQYAMRMRTTRTMSAPELTGLLNDVRPSVIENTLNKGTVFSAPGVSERYLGDLGKTHYQAGNMFITEKAANSSDKNVVGHEFVHAWQDTSKNPWTIAARAGTLVGYLNAQRRGVPYQPSYSGANMEGQASLYYGPAGSSYKKTPEWFRRLALAGYLQPAPVIRGWGERMARIRQGR